MHIFRVHVHSLSSSASDRFFHIQPERWQCVERKRNIPYSTERRTGALYAAPLNRYGRALRRPDTRTRRRSAPFNFAIKHSRLRAQRAERTDISASADLRPAEAAYRRPRRHRRPRNPIRKRAKCVFHSVFTFDPGHRWHTGTHSKCDAHLKCALCWATLAAPTPVRSPPLCRPCSADV